MFSQGHRIKLWCVSTKTFPNRFPVFNELEKKS